MKNMKTIIYSLLMLFIIMLYTIQYVITFKIHES